MAKKQITILIIIGLITGALGGILFDRVLIAHLSQVRGLSWITRYAANAPIVITRNEQVVLNEGVNLIDLTKQTARVTVSIYRGTVPQLTFAGLGVVMTSDGLIFTAKSVVGANQELTVVTGNGESFKGLVRALDPKSDLAVVSIAAKNLAVADFGATADLQAGQRVLTLGISNKEFQRRMNSAVVTNPVSNNKFLDQVFDTERLSDSFATNFAFDANFTGAPVVNLEGKLVAMLSNDRGEMVVVENLQSALSSYLQTGKIIRPRLKMKYWNVTSLQASLKNLPRAGALVLSMDPTSSAKGLLQPNDLIFELDGESLEDKSLEQVLNSHAPGEMKFKLIRTGKELELILNLEPTK